MLARDASLRRTRRPGKQDWLVDGSGTLFVAHSVQANQQWETPAEVAVEVRRRWSVDYDAMATPMSALAPDYATKEDGVLRVPLHDRVIFCNPAYAEQGEGCGVGGILPVLRKLVDGDVRVRGCTLVALLPSWTNQEWFARYVLDASEDRFSRPLHRQRPAPRPPLRARVFTLASPARRCTCCSRCSSSPTRIGRTRRTRRRPTRTPSSSACGGRPARRRQRPLRGAGSPSPLRPFPKRTTCGLCTCDGAVCAARSVSCRDTSIRCPFLPITFGAQTPRT